MISTQNILVLAHDYNALTSKYVPFVYVTASNWSGIVDDTAITSSAKLKKNAISLVPYP